MKQKYRGFTLVELLISVMIFSGIMGTFFSVVGSIRRAESFRDNTTTLTQAGSYAFEPLLRSIRDANGTELVTGLGGKAYCIRGFYLRGLDPGTGSVQTGNAASTLTTLSVDRQVNASNVVTNTLTRRDYSVATIAPATTPQLVETTYQISASSAIATCTSISWPATPVSTRTLTPSTVALKSLSYSLAAPLLKDNLPAGVSRLAPFATVSLVLDYASSKKGIAPLSVRSTVVPTFVYGERND